MCHDVPSFPYQVKDEFFLDVAHVGRFVGKGGSNIRSPLRFGETLDDDSKGIKDDKRDRLQPWRIPVGFRRLVSTQNCLFSGSLLIEQRVIIGILMTI
jgi:hypothetical protein